MNKQRIEQAIAMMENARQLDMSNFQFVAPGTPMSETIEDLHSCGNSACFAGYLALSPEFKAAGGYVELDGEPVIRDPETSQLLDGAEAVASWLGIHPLLASDIVYGSTHHFNRHSGEHVDFFPEDVEFEELRPHHVIEILQRILRGELS